MSNLKPLAASVALAAVLATSLSAFAKPVTYTLHTVADGQIGGRTFSQAKLTFTFTGDTRNVVQEYVSGERVYYNRKGHATIKVEHAGEVTVARFAAGEIYVQYNTTTGVVGFGSSIGPSYPVALDCDDDPYDGGPGCTKGDWNAGSEYGTADALVDIANTPGNVIYYSVSALSDSLSHSTLLTGAVSTCAVPYGLSITCPSPAPRGLSTDHGNFYVQDMFGYTDGFSHRNSGALRVEVSSGDD